MMMRLHVLCKLAKFDYIAANGDFLVYPSYNYMKYGHKSFIKLVNKTRLFRVLARLLFLDPDKFLFFLNRSEVWSWLNVNSLAKDIKIK